MPLGGFDFRTGPARPELRRGEIHVWRASLCNAPDGLDELLSPEETARAARFHFERDANRYRSGRGLLRVILARYVRLHPRRLSLTSGAHGKPLLDVQHGLRFNASHSGDLVLVAVAVEREVGIDLEMLRDDVDVERLAADILSVPAAEDLRSRPHAERVRRFFELWTETEAILKAKGIGLLQGTAIDDRERWTTLRLQPHPAYAAAVAAEVGPMQITTWSLL